MRDDRFDVGRIHQAGVGHDGRGVAVEQHHSVALLLERLARLGSAVIEFAGLADDDGAGANQENGVEIGSFRHGGQIRSVAL